MMYQATGNVNGLSVLADAVIHQLEAHIHETSREISAIEQSLQRSPAPAAPRPAQAPEMSRSAEPIASDVTGTEVSPTMLLDSSNPELMNTWNTPYESQSPYTSQLSGGPAFISQTECLPNLGLDPRSCVFVPATPRPAQAPGISRSAEPIANELTRTGFSPSMLPNVASHGPTSTPYVSQPPYTPQPYGGHAVTAQPGCLPHTGLDPSSRVVRELRKPALTIDKYTGDPTTYRSFMRQFNARILVHCETYDEAISYLLQYTKGEPKDIVNGYQHLDADIGYNAVIREFDRRYGDIEIVALAYVKRALAWPCVGYNDSAALDAFSIFLRECQYAVQQIDSMGTLEYPDNIRKLLAKLPDRLQERWRNIAFDIKERGQRARFHNFVDFIEREARKQKDPLYGRDAMQACTRNANSGQARQAPSSKPVPMPRKRDFKSSSEARTLLNTAVTTGDSASAEPPSAPVFTAKRDCPLCHADHYIFGCKEFKAKSSEERFATAKALTLCFNCLSPSHVLNSCRSTSRCHAEGCGKMHHTLLHRKAPPKPTFKTTATSNHTTQSSATVSNMGGSSTGDDCPSQTYFQLFPVYVCANGRSVRTVALLDSASQVTVMQESLAKELGLRGKIENFTVKTLSASTEKKSRVVSFKVRSTVDGAAPFDIKYARTLDIDSFQCSTQKLDTRWEHCQDLGIPDIIQPAEVKLLIGIDQPEAHLQIEVRRGQFDGPLAVRTPLGWSLMGTDGMHDQCDSANVNLLSADPTISQPSLDDQLSSFWSTESFGVTHHFQKPTSIEDCRATTQLEATTVLKDGHYEVGMLWRDSSSSLPNNFPVAQRRFDLLTKRLARDPQYALLYDAALSGYVQKGYARKMTPAEAREVSPRTWYLPHHGVMHPHKPGKLRVVFDAAASFKGHSLNNALLSGPDLLNSLSGVLHRFRLYDVALVGDIEAMYHQVRVPPADADSLRFLWKSDLGDPGPPDTFQMQSHVFGATDSTAAALYALRRTGEDHAHEFGPAVVEALGQDMYMDDLIKSVASVLAATSLIRDIPKLAAKGGFHIHKFVSNRPEVLSSVDETECAVAILDFDRETMAIQRTLGIQWDVKHDAFIFAFQPKDDAPLTKRGLVSVMSSVFDPLGFISPFTIRAKALAQQLWKSSVGWDDPLPEAVLEKWTKWLEELRRLGVFKLPRHHPCFTPDVLDIELHTFSDASEAAFAAVSFLRYHTADRNVCVSFLGSKSRVAPLKTLSIPRLELQGALLAARLAKSIESDLKVAINRNVFWTDSEVVLRYIKNETKRFKPFVANRVAEILDLTKKTEWRHVPTDENPADISTRGLAVTSLTPDSLWFQGPKFLAEDESSWPEHKDDEMAEIDPLDPEVKNELPTRRTVLNIGATAEGGGQVQPVDEKPHKFDVSSVVNLDTFSNLKPLLRRTAWVLRAVSNFASSVARFKCKPCREPQLTAAELTEAELHWVRVAQANVYAEELTSLRKGQSVGSKSAINQLTPFFDEDDQVLRVGGRLRHATIPGDAKFQVILPPKQAITTLITMAVHRRILHEGPEHTIAQLRLHYWPVRARVVVKASLRGCFFCVLRRAHPRVPRMADLPQYRLDVKRGPFHYVGLDYWGPMQIKQGRSTVKRWGCIFTCLTVRAVHLEVADGLDTENFLLCLRNFIARRGHPAHIYSDNGTNFHGANNQLAVCLAGLDQERVHNFLAPLKIQWHFNPPLAPHFGGAWERLVQSVKRALNASLQNTLVSDAVLRSAVTEVEGVLNSRPLTHASTDPADHSALTPNHFLLGRADSKVPPVKCEDREINSRNRWRQSQVIADRACQRWLREYLPNLTVRHRWTEENRCATVDDLVLVVDESLPRGCWELGRITAVYPGDDGRVRAVDVKTARNTFRRPVAKICVLEENV